MKATLVFTMDAPPLVIEQRFYGCDVGQHCCQHGPIRGPPAETILTTPDDRYNRWTKKIREAMQPEDADDTPIVGVFDHTPFNVRTGRKKFVEALQEEDPNGTVVWRPSKALGTQRNLIDMLIRQQCEDEDTFKLRTLIVVLNKKVHDNASITMARHIGHVMHSIRNAESCMPQSPYWISRHCKVLMIGDVRLGEEVITRIEDCLHHYKMHSYVLTSDEN